MQITQPRTDDEILATWEVMRQLRPHLAREEYVSLVRGMMESDGYRLAAVMDGGEVRGWPATASCTCCTAAGCCTWTTS